MSKEQIVKIASACGADIETVPGKWAFTLDELVTYTNAIKPQPLDMDRLDEYLPAWAYLELTSGMREEIVYVIQKQLGLVD